MHLLSQGRESLNIWISKLNKPTSSTLQPSVGKWALWPEDWECVSYVNPREQIGHVLLPFPNNPAWEQEVNIWLSRGEGAAQVGSIPGFPPPAPHSSHSPLCTPESFSLIVIPPGTESYLGKLEMRSEIDTGLLLRRISKERKASTETEPGAEQKEL